MLIKICSQCKEERDIDDFYKKGNRRYSYCRFCAKKYARKNYTENKERYKQGSKTRTLQLREEWKAFKRTLKCKCGESRPWCLDFHHIDTDEKEDELGNLYVNGSREAFENELQKCIVVCKNCHAEIHFKQFYEV